MEEQQHPPLSKEMERQLSLLANQSLPMRKARQKTLRGNRSLEDLLPPEAPFVIKKTLGERLVDLFKEFGLRDPVFEFWSENGATLHADSDVLTFEIPVYKNEITFASNDDGSIMTTELSVSLSTREPILYEKVYLLD